MILAAALLFAMAILGGTQVLFFHTRNEEIPTVVGLGHGAVSTGAIVLLWLGLGETGYRNLGGAALALALLAWVGGGYLFSFRFSRRRPPLAVMLAHGALAVAAVALLALHLLRGGVRA